MQISSTVATASSAPFDRQAANAQQATKTQGYGTTQAAAEQAKKDEEKAAEKKVFTPAPPLRPNIQDYVDINRTLIALRKI